MRKLSSFKRIALRSLAALALALGATHAASAEDCITDVMVVGGSSSSVTNSPAAVCPAWNQPYLSITAMDNLTGSNYVSTAVARVNGNQTVTLWGSGSPLREFLHVDDLASACLFLLEMENPPDLVNVGSGREVTIRQLAEMVKEATGSQAFIEWDRTKPDGTPRKLCDTRLIRKLGWAPKIDLTAGLRRTVDEYRAEVASGRVRV